jgi:hypothetical protein
MRINNVGGTVTICIHSRVFYGLELVTSIFKQGLPGGSKDANVKCLGNDRHAKAGLRVSILVHPWTWVCGWILSTVLPKREDLDVT